MLVGDLKLKKSVCASEISAGCYHEWKVSFQVAMLSTRVKPVQILDINSYDPDKSN
jgi:hypothetical protein